MSIEVVDRPTRGSGSRASDETRAFLATADTGKAIRVPLAGRTSTGLRSKFSMAAQYHGLVGHTMQDGPFMVAWCEAKPNGNGAH